ncbi:hypothetical protein GCM10027258_88980 [Amycolatopsis stemonae]
MLGRRRRQRIAPDRSGVTGAGDAQGQVLPGLGPGEWRAVVGGQVDRRHGRAFGHRPDHAQRPEAAPPGRCGGGPRGEEVAERRLPAGAERGDVDGLAERGLVAVRQVEERVDVRDAHFVPAAAGADDLVARPDVAFGDDAQVEARPVVRDEQGRHPRLAQAHPDAEARDARLGDLEFGVADAVPVADVHLVVGQAVDGEVLAELAVLEVVAAEEVPPVLVGPALVDEHRAVLAAVPAQVALAVAVDVEPADQPPAVDGVLEDSGVDGPALPGHVLRQSDVERHQARHGRPLHSAVVRERW